MSGHGLLFRFLGFGRFPTKFWLCFSLHIPTQVHMHGGISRSLNVKFKHALGMANGAGLLGFLFFFWLVGELRTLESSRPSWSGGLEPNIGQNKGR